MVQKRKVKTTPKAKKNLTKVNKAATLQKVVMHRHLDYIYPKGCIEPLKRKSYRQKVRDRITKLESDISKLRGEARKERKLELNAYVIKHKTEA